MCVYVVDPLLVFGGVIRKLIVRAFVESLLLTAFVHTPNGPIHLEKNDRK